MFGLVGGIGLAASFVDSSEAKHHGRARQTLQNTLRNKLEGTKTPNRRKTILTEIEIHNNKQKENTFLKPKRSGRIVAALALPASLYMLGKPYIDGAFQWAKDKISR
jgi:hypothetical protein